MKRLLAFLLFVSLIFSLVACGTDEKSSNDKKSTIKCTECGKKVDASSKFCPNCGTDFETESPDIAEKECSSCGEKIDASSNFCPNCGTDFETESPDIAEKECSSCGEIIDASSNFCPNCGNDNTPPTENPGGEDNDSNVQNPAEKIWLKLKSQNLNNEKICTAYTYDYYGNLVLESSSDGHTRTNIKYTNTYDANNRITKTEYTVSKPSYTYLYEIHYIYNSDGILTEKITYRTEGSQKYINSYTVYEDGKTMREYNRYLKYHGLDNAIEENYGYRVIGYIYDLEGKLESQYVHNKYTPFRFDITLEEIKNAPLSADTITITEYLYDANDHIIDSIPYSTMSHYIAETKELTITEENLDLCKVVHPEYINCLSMSEISIGINSNIYDEHNNLIEDSRNKYEYMTLAQYREQGLYSESSGSGEVSGSYCVECKENGYNICQGHYCTECEGAGILKCPACKGTGKEAFEINGNDTCRTCYGEGSVDCVSCISGKWFYK